MLQGLNCTALWVFCGTSWLSGVYSSFALSFLVTSPSSVRSRLLLQTLHRLAFTKTYKHSKDLMRWRDAGGVTHRYHQTCVMVQCDCLCRCNHPDPNPGSRRLMGFELLTFQSGFFPVLGMFPRERRLRCESTVHHLLPFSPNPCGCSDPWISLKTALLSLNLLKYVRVERNAGNVTQDTFVMPFFAARIRKNPLAPPAD